VISLGHSLRMQTCAEGVETERQLSILRAEGCDEVQGYYFGKPMPVAEFELMYGAWRREGHIGPRAQMAGALAS
jgi:EAL domain-containing protein (putative c-di-GMP-specific phosphodiesterase class I)